MGGKGPYQHGAVQHAQRSFHLYGEIHVPWGVDDVHVAVFPFAIRSRALNRDSFFPFKLHGVHLGAHAVSSAHFVDLGNSAGVEQDAFGEGCFSGIDVRADAYVTCLSLILI